MNSSMSGAAPLSGELGAFYITPDCAMFQSEMHRHSDALSSDRVLDLITIGTKSCFSVGVCVFVCAFIVIYAKVFNTS